MPTGMRGSYDDANLQPLSLNPMLTMIDWTEAVLLRYFGVNNEKRFRFTAWPRREYYWQDDIMAPRSTTLAEDISIGETAWDVAVGTGQYFKEGDILLVDSELVYVSSRSSDTLTVIKGFAGTTDTTHTSGATVTYATIARLEGADYDLGYTTTVSRHGNYTQILSEAVSATESELVEQHYSIDDIIDYNIAKLIGGGYDIGSKGTAGKLAILLQQTFYYGRAALGSATTARAMAGFEGLVTTNVQNKAGAQLDLSMIEDLMELCFNAGGEPRCAIMNTHQWRIINTFWEDQIRTTRQDSEGGQVIKSIRTLFGDIDIVFDRWCPQDRLYLVEKEKVGWVTYRPFMVKDRITQGDYQVKEVVGEFGFVVQNEKSHGILTNLATT